MRIVIDGTRWGAVRKALGWTQDQMWAHFAKSVMIRVRVPLLVIPKKPSKPRRSRNP